MRTKTLLSAIVLTAALAGCRPANPVLEIEGGKIQGVESSVKGVYIYKGIPFAAPPVGDLRWKEPQPVIPWEGVKLADTFGPGSVQVNHDASNPWTSEFYWEDPEFSEDCLYLNVWTPAPGKPEKKLPVAMWIHGGAYTGGWGYEPEFDGKVWAEKGVVLVTINYRLGIFGFLVHPFLAEESPNQVSGNYGLLDQIAALKWIHANIAAFGGDPDNITILGQSAGAGSVKALVSSPLTGDLIKKAIIQSGGGVNVPPAGAPVPQPASTDLIATAVKGVFDWAGYDTLEKMRAASTEDIFGLAERYAAETGIPFRMSARPVIDGYVSTESFDAAALEGRIKDIPYMIGYTRDDMGNPEEGIRRFCELRNAAGQPVFAYQFAHALPDDEAGSHDMKGAFHSSELWYMFKSLDRGDRPFTEADWALAEHVVSCWTNFAKTGDPGLGWKAYTPDAPEFMVFDLSEDGSKDASAMGAPLKRRE
jgi:para-nitrobenzyl esterase